MIEMQPDKIIEKITNKKTGERYKNDKEWKDKGISPEDIRRDVTVIMPSLDLLGETKQNRTMAITRAQQAKQMLQNGGRIGLQEGGGIEQRLEQLGGDVTSAEQMLQGINQRLKTAESSLGSGGGSSLAADVFTSAGATGGPQVTTEDLKKIASNKIGGLTVTNLGQLPTEPTGLGIFAKNISPPTMTGLANVSLPEKLIPIDPYKNTMLSGLSQDGQRFDSAQSAFDALAEQTRKAREVNPFTRDVIGTEFFQGAEGFKSFTDMFNKINDPSYVAPSPQLASQGSLGIPAAGYADGGIMNSNVVGGEFDFESARQMYGLGKLVKKVTRTVKKIAKSPIGKAAMLYFAPALIPRGASTLGGVFQNMGGLGGLKTKFLGSAGKFITQAKGTPLERRILSGASEGILGKLGLTSGFGGGLTTSGISTAITAASLLPLLGIGTGEESEEEAEELIRGEGLDINAIRANPNQFLARRFRAEGGSMKEPVAKKTMPLLDMGGKEMDLRAEGGFVPIGRMEKADDVPARLSKNEFVFTADAVRNAGDGDVDKGAEVMYNMMKNLESGGDVSEESQGLEGARKMFQTSQRLEEVL